MRSSIAAIARCVARTAVVSFGAFVAAAPTPAAAAKNAPSDAGPDIESTFPLRQAAMAAMAGNADVALVVAARLVKRYERSGATDDLFEAVIWRQRFQSNDAFAKSGLLQHVRQKGLRAEGAALSPAVRSRRVTLPCRTRSASSRT